MISQNKITFFFLPLHQFIRRYIIEIMLGRRQLREKVMQNIYAYNSLGTEGEERAVEKNYDEKYRSNLRFVHLSPKFD